MKFAFILFVLCQTGLFALPAEATMKAADGSNQNEMNVVWTMVAGFLIMFVQAGFALLETGLCRAKNSSHTMLMNFLVYAIGATGFWICGFDLMYGANPFAQPGNALSIAQENEFSLSIAGNQFGLFAHNAFFLSGQLCDVRSYALFFFQLIFMATAVTIPTGAMAERWNLKTFYVFVFFVSMFLYPVFGNWTWGGGWLSHLGVDFGLGHGFVDFAGSGVVHVLGGFCALAGAIVLGPRIGKYNSDGSVNPIPAHHVPMALLGAFILAFGWFGFSVGSAMTVAGGIARASMIGVSTLLAGAGGALTATTFLILRTHRPDPTMIANGTLGGLVAISASSGFVSAPIGFLIGALAGILVCLSVDVLDRIHIDDPVGAISVHGVCGVFGVLAVGIFADGAANYGGSWNGVSGPVKGILHGDASQLFAQLVALAALVIWAFGISFLFFKLLNKIIGMRVPEQVEVDGLDIPETGIMGYPSFPSTD